jgi:hypothetical protein
MAPSGGPEFQFIINSLSELQFASSTLQLPVSVPLELPEVGSAQEATQVRPQTLRYHEERLPNGYIIRRRGQVYGSTSERDGAGRRNEIDFDPARYASEEYIYRSLSAATLLQCR